MKIRFLFSITLLFILSVQTLLAWENMPTPRLHVDGRYLKDTQGNTVNLHGFAQTYSPWFNERGQYWSNYDVDGCLTYNKGLIDDILNAGWKMNFLRLHMDPYWSNETGCTPDGHELPNCFSETRFRKYLDEVFIPMAENAISKGLYVVMRPPGISPEVIDVENETELVIDLNRMKKEVDGQIIPVDPSHIYIAGFWSVGGSPILIEDVFLSNSDEYDTSVQKVVFEELKPDDLVEVYSVAGKLIQSQVKRKDALSGLSTGIYIIGNADKGYGKVVVTQTF